MTELTAIAPDIWLVEGDCVSFYGFPYPTRSVVVRLADGGLWFWSPLKFDAQLKAALDELGEVRHLVSPNKLHHLFMGDWQRRYPQAHTWGPQSTIDKRSDITFDRPALSEPAPEEWAKEIEQVWIHGSPFMDEVLFFHKASRTLIMADFSENFSKTFLKRHWPFWARPIASLWKIVEGFGYAPLEWRLSFRDKSLLREAKARLLAADPENVVMAHGVWQKGKGRAFLERALAWI
ncbi:DUF4336 domain-containing protein [Altericroceibacterium endophyticum]|uniref:DUF4336 domain-containing protein n=1 Tax=Altericroceibacterium endophyticum TaxID=1808508 RepID=A0A6I4T3U3_9SPHN|nr:DUF4336 domain-containing protein [Altericroceibacterium endophyticum]MXO64932.1 DUF4336 domain-containing protein [Altericroceibacterium endophyticum]